MTVDTLRYAEELQLAGVSPEAAKVHAQALSRAVHNTVATKTDIADVHTEVAGLKTTLRTDLLGMETRLRDKMDGLYWGVFYLLAATFIATIAAVAGILALVK